MTKAALDAKRANVFLIDPNDVKLVTDKSHWLYDKRVERPVKTARVHAMLTDGFTSVIDVCKEGDEVLVVAGRGRVKDARVANELIARYNQLSETTSNITEMAAKLGLPEAVVKEMPDEPIMLRAQVVRGDEKKLFGRAVMENQLRDDDNDPLAQAEKCQKLIDLGRDVDQVAIRFGQSPSWVKGRLKLLEVAPEVKKALAEGTITTSDALRMAGQSVEDQKKTLEATPKKDPTEPTKRRPGKRGKSPRPTKSQMQKMLDYLGDGSEGALWIKVFLGVEGAREALVRKHKGLADIFDLAAKRRKKKGK